MTTKFARRKLILKQPPVCRRSPPCLEALPDPDDAMSIECWVTWHVVNPAPPAADEIGALRVTLTWDPDGFFSALVDLPSPPDRQMYLTVTPPDVIEDYVFYANFMTHWEEVVWTEEHLWQWPPDPPYRVAFRPDTPWGDIMHVQLAVYIMPGGS